MVRLHDARTLNQAYLRYAVDHDHKVTTDPAVLFPDYVNDRSLFTFTDYDGSQMNYIHFPVGDLRKRLNRDETIIFAAPKPYRKTGKRIVTFADGHVGLLTEEEYKNAVKKQTSVP